LSQRVTGRILRRLLTITQAFPAWLKAGKRPPAEPFFALTGAGHPVTLPPDRSAPGYSRLVAGSMATHFRNLLFDTRKSVFRDRRRSMTTHVSQTGSHRPLAPGKTVMSRQMSLWAACLLTGSALAVLTLPGCSGSAGTATAAGADQAKATVATFLEAIKRGDDAGARAMLTKVARAKTEELGISVAPPVASTATYSIRETEAIAGADDLVHVGTTWTDTDTDGFTSTENIVWAVRLDPEGWRVAGMATKIFEDLPPLLLNFEDPEDMIAKQEMVALELQRRAQQAAAKQPEQRTAAGPTGGPVKK
jgi:hypothetical protein